ncbi:SGNH/GDSL hydrolase family protein [Ensifer sp. MJa1]|uniref:SGNH/GDSL hydrolase family protein n=1 Tax=Ensifer sp. MJa1 TaxID=2919888 RepID=UPI00300B3D24
MTSKRRTQQRRTALEIATICIAAMAMLVVGLYAGFAEAQQRVQRRTLFQVLFGGLARERPVYEDRSYFPEQPRPKRQRQQQQRQKGQGGQQKTKPKLADTPAPVPQVVEKAPDAKKVLVVGDFMAGSVGDGLKTAFEMTPGITVETRANGSSGLVREDYFNWPGTLPGYVAEVKPSVIIVSLGANDRQMMQIGDVKEKFRTDLWTEEYRKRVNALAALARKEKLPVLWVGMPPFQSAAMTADMVTFNGIYREEIEKVGGQFVDIWDGFVDEGGKFVLTGSDINGQQVRLRGADGINLTKAGKRKLAFYVEKDIRRLLGDAAATDKDIPGADGLKDLVVTAPLANEDIVKTQPIGLTDPELDGAGSLLGNAAPAKGTGKSPRDLLVDKGDIATAPAGRVDDFRLAKPSTVISNPVIRN